MTDSKKTEYARQLLKGDPYACVHAPCCSDRTWTCDTCQLRTRTAEGTTAFINAYLPSRNKMRDALKKIATLSTNREIERIAREALE